MANNQTPGMTPERAQKYVQRVLQDAVNFMESTLQGPRELADIYYQGGTDLIAPDGRSQVIVDCVRAGVQSVIPSIARIFTQTDTVAEFWTDIPRKSVLLRKQLYFVTMYLKSTMATRPLLQWQPMLLKRVLAL